MELLWQHPSSTGSVSQPAILKKVAVSNNVCHTVYYDREWQKALGSAAEIEARNAAQSRRAVAFRLMFNAMEEYLQHKPGGKKVHDPLALAVDLDESVCELSEVNCSVATAAWGSRLSLGSNIWISVAYDALKFRAAVLA